MYIFRPRATNYSSSGYKNSNKRPWVIHVYRPHTYLSLRGRTFQRQGSHGTGISRDRALTGQGSHGTGLSRDWALTGQGSHGTGISRDRVLTGQGSHGTGFSQDRDRSTVLMCTDRLY